MSRYWRLGFIGLVAIASLFVVWPQQPASYFPFGEYLPGNPGIHIRFGTFHFDRQGTKLGLDLQGGTHLVLQADMSKKDPDQDAESTIKGVIRVLERRVNAYGVAEPVIQASGADRVIVELPGVRDIEEAKKLIGQTAQLDFREQEAGGQWKVATATGSDGQQKELTGKFFRPTSQVVFDPRTNQPQVAFEFDSEGAILFEQITRRLINRPLGIFLDNQLISAPTVQAVISQNGVITGVRINDARTLAIQLNAGAVPVPISIIEERTVDASLGSDSVRKSVIAGEIALLVVALFMVLYYRLPGLLASIALIIYALITLAIFKLIPVTLTLAGIAGFILSIGMAVDANILIFERMREEIRWGKGISQAIRAGFERAWSSIYDSNVSTLITCGLLYLFGQNFGASLIMGFALTLAIGVGVSLFTAIVVTRTLLSLVVGSPLIYNPTLFGIEVPDTRVTRPSRLRLGEEGASS